MLGVFARLESAARKSPRRPASLIPVGEQDAVVSVDDDGVRADMLGADDVLYVFDNQGELVAYEITAQD